MVIAANLKEAAKRLGTSCYDMRRHGWNYAVGEDRDIYMKACHNHPLYRPIDHYPPFTYWSLG